MVLTILYKKDALPAIDDKLMLIDDILLWKYSSFFEKLTDSVVKKMIHPDQLRPEEKNRKIKKLV